MLGTQPERCKTLPSSDQTEHRHRAVAMRPSSRLPLLTLSSIFLSAHSALAQPAALVPVQNDERSLADLFGAAAAGNLTSAVDDLITDATTLITDFIGAVKEFHNATNENDLVELLGVDLNNDAENDETSVTNNTVGAVGANATCPGMAVLFARGTAEAGMLSEDGL